MRILQDFLESASGGERLVLNHCFILIAALSYQVFLVDCEVYCVLRHNEGFNLFNRVYGLSCRHEWLLRLIVCMVKVANALRIISGFIILN